MFSVEMFKNETDLTDEKNIHKKKKNMNN